MVSANEGESKRPLTVSQAMAAAKGALEQVTLTLVGEVSEVSIKSGYKAAYFTVKDAGASMPCMMWMNRYKQTGVELRVGSLVQLTGRFTLYAPKGRMNFDVFALRPAGEGDLRQRVADLAKKLQREGLMDAARKRAVPVMPEVIGLVTSPRGAAVHDVLRTLRRRFPMARILLAGVTVEGQSAARDMADAITVVQSAGAQVVLLVRGGGSFEDLMPFNDEGLARAIAACPVPVVTGIGHEPDTSIADMVADVRASTPTAAAEAVAPTAMDIRAQLDANADVMLAVLQRRIERARMSCDNVSSRPVFADPRMLFSNDALAMDIMQDRLHRAIPANLKKNDMKLESTRDRLLLSGATLTGTYEESLRLQASRLNDLSPLAVLGRGFAMARNDAGDIMRSVDQTAVGAQVQVTLADGELSCRVESKSNAETTAFSWKEDQ